VVLILDILGPSPLAALAYEAKQGRYLRKLGRNTLGRASGGGTSGGAEGPGAFGLDISTIILAHWAKKPKPLKSIQPS
jgi:hypothetical protein